MKDLGPSRIIYEGHLPPEILVRTAEKLYDDIEVTDSYGLAWKDVPTRAECNRIYFDSVRALSRLFRASTTLALLVRPFLYRSVKLCNWITRSFIKTIISSLAETSEFEPEELPRLNQVVDDEQDESPEERPFQEALKKVSASV